MHHLGPALACYAVNGMLCSLELNKRKKKDERRKGLGQVQAAQVRKKPDLAVGARSPTVSFKHQIGDAAVHLQHCCVLPQLLPTRGTSAG